MKQRTPHIPEITQPWSVTLLENKAKINNIFLLPEIYDSWLSNPPSWKKLWLIYLLSFSEITISCRHFVENLISKSYLKKVIFFSLKSRWYYVILKRQVPPGAVTFPGLSAFRKSFQELLSLLSPLPWGLLQPLFCSHFLVVFKFLKCAFIVLFRFIKPKNGFKSSFRYLCKSPAAFWRIFLSAIFPQNSFSLRLKGTITCKFPTHVLYLISNFII